MNRCNNRCIGYSNPARGLFLKSSLTVVRKSWIGRPCSLRAMTQNPMLKQTRIRMKAAIPTLWDKEHLNAERFFFLKNTLVKTIPTLY